MLFPLLPLRLGGSLFPPLRIQCKNPKPREVPYFLFPFELQHAAAFMFLSLFA